MPFAIPLADRIEALLQCAPAESDSSNVPLSATILHAVENALDRGETHYTERPGILALRQRIAGLLERRFALETDARNHIIVTCGITEARFVASQQVLRPGGKITASVSSHRLSGAAILRGISIVKSAADSNAIYLTSSTAETKLRNQIDATPAEAFILYEIDEHESHFHPAQLPGCVNRTLTLGALGAESWRVGYLAAPSSLSSCLRDFKQSLTICTTNLSQWAMLAAMEEA
jgi:aspartate/methionine/tyrosine aminotransferase